MKNKFIITVMIFIITTMTGCKKGLEVNSPIPNKEKSTKADKLDYIKKASKDIKETEVIPIKEVGKVDTYLKDNELLIKSITSNSSLIKKILDNNYNFKIEGVK